MILPNLILPKTQNLICQYYEPDTPALVGNKKYFEKYPYPIDYRFNSRGYRDTEWPKLLKELQQAVWCVGDSSTVGIGSPFEHTWPHRLQLKLNRRAINISMVGAGNDWIARKTIDIIQEVEPKIIVINWSYLHRREATVKAVQDKKWSVFYNDIRDPSWPKSTTLDDFNNLPQYIQKEINMHHNTEWRKIDDIDRRLNFEKTTTTKDIDHTLALIDSVESLCKFTKIIHTFIPEFIDAAHKIEFNLKVSAKNLVKVPEIVKLDLARDRHHYDIITADKFATQISQLI